MVVGFRLWGYAVIADIDIITSIASIPAIMAIPAISRITYNPKPKTLKPHFYTTLLAFADVSGIS